MFLRHKDIVINTDTITSIKITENSKHLSTGKMLNYLVFHFSGEDKETFYFDTNEQLREFLEHFQIRNV